MKMTRREKMIWSLLAGVLVLLFLLSSTDLIIKEKKLRTIQQLHTLIPYVSVEYILYILRLFRRYWKDRIYSYFIPFDALIHKRCIEIFHHPFMQSRNCSISFM